MGGDELAAEAAALKQKIRDARKDVCDTHLSNETESMETIKLALRVRKTLRGHLSKVCLVHVNCDLLFINVWSCQDTDNWHSRRETQTYPFGWRSRHLTCNM